MNKLKKTIHIDDEIIDIIKPMPRIIKNKPTDQLQLDRLTEMRDTLEDIYEYISTIGNMIFIIIFAYIIWSVANTLPECAFEVSAALNNGRCTASP
jgi:hypothetical protein